MNMKTAIVVYFNYQYMDSHYKDKTVSQPYYLYHGGFRLAHKMCSNDAQINQLITPKLKSEGHFSLFIHVYAISHRSEMTPGFKYLKLTL